MSNLKRNVQWLIERTGYSVVRTRTLLAERARLEGETKALSAERARLDGARNALTAERALFEGEKNTLSAEWALLADAKKKIPADVWNQIEAEKGRGASEWKISPRSLEPIDVEHYFDAKRPVTIESIESLRASSAYEKVVRYFQDYPSRSLMSDHSRAVLYSLLRMVRPAAVAEIGTLFAGTTEVLARALWENGHGVVYTADPFGDERCPILIDQWPRALQEITRFYGEDSMMFLARLEQTKTSLDFVLVDGNHDFEFALFDLQMAAKLLRPGGIIVMDNAEQTGPFEAARQFLAQHPQWHELGGAVSNFNLSKPFAMPRCSIADTTFVVLQAPPHFLLRAVPRSWGQEVFSSSRLAGFSLDLPPQSSRGALHFQAILRAFADANRTVEEYKSIGTISIVLSGTSQTLQHKLAEPLISQVQGRDADCKHTFENEFVWQAAPGSGPLSIATSPRPIS